MERKLYVLGIPISQREFVVAILFSTVLVAALLYPLGPKYSLLSLLVPAAAYLSVEYLYSRHLSEIRQELPRFIHYLSTYPSLTLRDVLRVGKSGFGTLSRELSVAYSMVERGVSPSRALRGIVRRIDDPEVKRVFETLLASFMGGNPRKLLEGLSEELYFSQELEGERRATLSIQRYSIALSAFVLVPFILGIVVAMVERLGSVPTDVVSLIPPYLIILSLISGSFLAWTEGKPKNALLYIFLGALSSLLIYWVVLWLY